MDGAKWQKILGKWGGPFGRMTAGRHDSRESMNCHTQAHRFLSSAKQKENLSIEANHFDGFTFMK